MSDDSLRRLQTGELELGVAEATQRHVSRRVKSAPPASAGRLAFERRRPQWLREMLAEAFGVFFYVFPGIAAVAAQVTAIYEEALIKNSPPAPVIGSITNVAFGFGFGIAFAIICFAPTSGGQFNPAITIAFTIFQGFPVRKAIRYIFAQITGAFVAGLFVYGMYRQSFQLIMEAGVPKRDLIQVFCAFPLEYQTAGYLFLIEFFVDSFIAFVIWSVLDPANPFIAPFCAPWVIGLAYTSMIFGFGAMTISTNLARDLGTRMVAAAFLGTEAFTYKSYSAISILVNIPASLFAITIYEFVFRDTFVAIKDGHLSHPHGLSDEDVKDEIERRESNTDQAAFASTRLGRFLSNRHSGEDAREHFSDHAK
ncbi:hypothetical protein PYCC9005_003406 [Savitreella phatthalungensis]